MSPRGTECVSDITGALERAVGLTDTSPIVEEDKKTPPPAPSDRPPPHPRGQRKDPSAAATAAAMVQYSHIGRFKMGRGDCLE